MGHGIALEFALAEYEVSLHSRSDESLRRATQNIQSSLGQLVALGKVTGQRAAAAPAKIRGSTDLATAVVNADVVIESVYEDLALKQQIFAELERLCPERTLLASNTSGLMPSAFTSGLRRRDKVLVAHYANPPHLIPLVEVVPTQDTSRSTITTISDLLTKIGKRPIVIRKEVPGFVLNRLQGALLREALWLVENGVADPQDVDVALRSSIGRRWAAAGIFEIFEIAGWDLVMSVAADVMPHLSSSTEVPRVLKEKVERGELGVKTGKGFYDWTPESVAALKLRIARALVEIETWS
jgi:3-hydroxybutyryl-CoA dehydrogenase